MLAVNSLVCWTNDGATVGLESISHDTYGSIVVHLSNSYDGFIDIIFLDYTASQDRFHIDAQLSTTIDNDSIRK